jgi:hypothetical protein
MQPAALHRGSSPAISLRVGINLVEIEVLPADGTTTVGLCTLNQVDP